MKTGNKQDYRCNKVKKKGQQCASAAQLFYHNNSHKVSLFKTSELHTCEENHPNQIAGVPLKSRPMLADYVSCGVKPKKILEKLRESNLPVPKYGALCNFIRYNIRNNKFNQTTISLGQLEQWCIDNSEKIPDDEDEPFVIDFTTHYEEEEFDDNDDVNDDTNDDDFYDKNYFRFFLTTKRLIKIAAESKNMHADATYKLIWQGFPVLIPGTTDANRKFHPFGLAVCTCEKQKDFEFIFQSVIIALQKLNLPDIKPTVLVADGSDAIRNAFVEVFKCTLLVMCWAHMLRACKKHLINITKELKEEIIDDIKTLQLSQSKEVFEAATKLFLKKHKSEKEFITYFKNEWVDTHDGWYEGYAELTPSTTNALESNNRYIKDNGTLRSKLDLSVFLNTAKQIVQNWSRDRNTNDINCIKFAKEKNSSDLTLKEWTQGFLWARTKKEILSNENIHYVPCHGDSKINTAELSKYKNQSWTTFNQFKKINFKFYCVTMFNEEWMKSKCTCANYLKTYSCKHIIGIALRLKLCKAPAAAKDIQIGQKRKRGRPKKSLRGKALLVE